MASLDDGRSKRKLKVNMADLEMAFDNTSTETSCFLDTDTGEVAMVIDDVRRELEKIYERIYGEDANHRYLLSKRLVNETRPSG